MSNTLPPQPSICTSIFLSTRVKEHDNSFATHAATRVRKIVWAFHRVEPPEAPCAPSSRGFPFERLQQFSIARAAVIGLRLQALVGRTKTRCSEARGRLLTPVPEFPSCLGIARVLRLCYLTAPSTSGICRGWLNRNGDTSQEEAWTSFTAKKHAFRGEFESNNDR
jgi:hypothetical protein